MLKLVFHFFVALFGLLATMPLGPLSRETGGRSRRDDLVWVVKVCVCLSGWSSCCVVVDVVVIGA